MSTLKLTASKSAVSTQLNDALVLVFADNHQRMTTKEQRPMT
jgi:hypothetical protein